MKRFLLALWLMSVPAFGADVNITNIVHAGSVATTDYLLGNVGATGPARLFPVSLFPILSGSQIGATYMPALTGDITTSAGSVATTLVAGNAGNLNSGTLLTARLPALTGDVTTSAGSAATTIANDAVTYAKMQNVSATQRALGRNTAGAGDPEEVTASQLLDWIGSTRGSVLYRGSGSWSILAPGTSGFVLTSQGAGADPQYAAAAGGTSIDFEATQFVTNTAGVKLTIKSAALTTNMVNSGIVTLTDAATVATDASLSTTFKVTLAGNRTLGNPTNAKDGERLTWEVIQDGTGSRTLAMDTKFAFGTDITGITLTTTASKRDFITAFYDSTADKFYVTGFVRGY